MNLAEYEAWVGPVPFEHRVRTKAKVIWLVGDLHLGAKTVDLAKLKRHMKIAKAEGAAVFNMGDAVECVTLGSKVAGAGAMYDQFVPGDGTHPLNWQAEAFVRYFEGMEILGHLRGNHEKRLWTQGYDLAGDFARQLGGANLGILASVEVNGAHFLLSHGEGGGARHNELRRRDYPGHDVIASGHDHTLGSIAVAQGKQVAHLIKTGNYLGRARYSMEKQYAGAPAPTGSVLVYLRRGEVSGVRLLI